MTSSRSFKIETPPNAGFVWQHENFFLRRLLFSCLVALASFSAEASAASGNVASLTAVETAFAEESIAKGGRNAFLDALFEPPSPGPQNAKRAWQAKENWMEL